MADAADDQPEVTPAQEETTVTEDDAASHTADTSDVSETQESAVADAGQNLSAGTVSTRWKRKTTVPVGNSCYPNPKIIPNSYNSASQKLASPISEIRPYLFISGYGSVSAKKLRELGITHVIDATNIPNTHAKDVEYLEVPISDNEREGISKYFQPAADFIRAAKDKGGKVIVFSGAGKSRAAVLSMIYLVVHEGLSLKESFFEVARARPIILPNLGFWRQMIKFEADKHDGKASVELLKGMAKAVPDVYLQRRQLAAQKC